MKKYLVSYITNHAVSDLNTMIVETDDDYQPAGDDMKLLKEKIGENNPRYTSIYPRKDGFSNMDSKLIPVDKLKIIAVSNLNV